ncbi:MAG: clostripain-related cysteine peptidase [Vicinamibacteria bacterium]
MTDASKRKPWAVLAYTVADDKGHGDSLDVSASEELKAICNAADFDQLSVAAQVDFKNAKGVFRGVLTEAPPKTRGFEDIPAESHPLWRSIKARLDRSRLRVMEEQNDLNSARANVLKSFLRFGQQQCPADRYVVFFYGHGYGPLGVFFDSDADRTDLGTMQLAGLADSMETVGDRAAVIVFRSCMANSLETAYQLKDAGEFMIASQSIVPIAGIWPWQNFLAALMPSAASGDVGQAIARQIASFLETPANRTPFAYVPFSLIDLGAAQAIAQPLKALADTLDAARHEPSRLSACAKALESARVGFPGEPANPGDPALLDVPTLCDNLLKLENDPVAGPARAIGNIVGSRLVKWHHSVGGQHRGISLYYQPVKPEQVERSCIYDSGSAAGDAAHYKLLALSQDTGWERLALNPLV